MTDQLVLPKIRIESMGIFGYQTYVDGVRIPKVIETRIDLNSVPKRATIEFLVDAEPIEFEGIVEKKIFAYIGNKKYDISEVVQKKEYKDTDDIIIFTEFTNCAKIKGKIIKKGISKEFDKPLYIIESLDDHKLYLRYGNEIDSIESYNKKTRIDVTNQDSGFREYI